MKVHKHRKFINLAPPVTALWTALMRRMSSVALSFKLWMCEEGGRESFFATEKMAAWGVGGWGNNFRAYRAVLTKRSGLCVCVCLSMWVHACLIGGGLTDPSKAKFTQEWWEQVNTARTEWWWVGGAMERIKSCFSSDRDRGWTHNPNRGFLFKASWSGFITCRTFILGILSGFFSVFLLSNISFVSLHFIFVFFFFFFFKGGSWAGSAGCNFLGKQRNGTGELSQYTYSLPFPPLPLGCQWKMGFQILVYTVGHDMFNRLNCNFDIWAAQFELFWYLFWNAVAKLFHYSLSGFMNDVFVM